ncbi:cation-translocating P-type ATPase [Arundinibacter roseus]|uniref:HAD family hydrolase n=1 Tax=Arundinibacter roseus TaxID=2070510 RepID=A0A4V2X951_9BACT|nr:HAD-IC family P-type ATPase [Arundinibacter roseus]TDB62345.1 HAD family hydrolase [Arundinibacter roseus]
MNINYPLELPHTRTVDEVVEEIKSHPAKGLSPADAQERTKAFGRNAYESQAQKSLWMMALLQFKSPIVYLLLVAVAVTFYFQNTVEALAILAVILINAIIGFLMELQARSSMNALKEMDVTLSRVIRDGQVQEIPSEEITPGDLIFLEAGDVVPADARLVEANQLQCDESSLTGESLPTEKNTEKLPKDTTVGDQHNMLFKGTSVMNGNGKALVTGIGHDTQLGTITALVEASGEQETPLDRKIAELSKRLIWVTLLVIVLYAITGFIQGKEWVLVLETSIALAVAAFPEGLPIVSTVALAYGMLLMAKRNAIVKRLSSVETLGSTNVILTDKTGTLTENKIYVDTFSFTDTQVKVRIEDKKFKFENELSAENEEQYQKILLIGTLCNDATLYQEGEEGQSSGDPIELALLQLIAAAGKNEKEIKETYKRKAEIPFSSDTKMMGTLHHGPDGTFVAAKGSVEQLLEQCTYILQKSEIESLADNERQKILKISDELAADGLRVLAFAYRENVDDDAGDFLNSLVFAGMIGFLDPPRMDIKDAILSCRNAGIHVVMITGDHPKTALNIAVKVGLVDAGTKQVLTGTELPAPEELSDDWKRRILETSVFARTTPKQKLDIVAIFQEDGNIVAMTGDGVNDAPALKKADIGIAMGLRGTQVAKETASIVLKDDSFTSIAEAVAHGREIFQNIQKFVIFLVSCNLSEILIVTVMGFVAPASTLLPLQILFLNMVTDVFPALALGLGKGDNTVMNHPPKDPAAPIVSNKDWVAVGIYSAAMTAAVMGAMIYADYRHLLDEKAANNVAFLTLVFAQLFHVFNMASADSGIVNNEVTRNRFVWLAIVICTGIMALVFAVPSLRTVLGLYILPVRLWVIALVASALPLVVVQTYKAVSNLVQSGKE